jgi:hypothetical protein
MVVSRPRGKWQAISLHHDRTLGATDADARTPESCNTRVPLTIPGPRLACLTSEPILEKIEGLRAVGTELADLLSGRRSSS